MISDSKHIVSFLRGWKGKLLLALLVIALGWLAFYASWHMYDYRFKTKPNTEYVLTTVWPPFFYRMYFLGVLESAVAIPLYMLLNFPTHRLLLWLPVSVPLFACQFYKFLVGCASYEDFYEMLPGQTTGFLICALVGLARYLFLGRLVRERFSRSQAVEAAQP